MKERDFINYIRNYKKHRDNANNIYVNGNLVGIIKSKNEVDKIEIS